MMAWKSCVKVLAFVACVLTANWAWALGFELTESKDALKLKYEVKVSDHETGRVTAELILADEGRLGPLTAIDLYIPDAKGSGYADLSISLAVRKVDGKQVVTVHLLKDLAERASIQLKTRTLDGKQQPLTWYYHSIPLKHPISAGK